MTAERMAVLTPALARSGPVFCEPSMADIGGIALLADESENALRYLVYGLGLDRLVFTDLFIDLG